MFHGRSGRRFAVALLALFSSSVMVSFAGKLLGTNVLLGGALLGLCVGGLAWSGRELGMVAEERRAAGREARGGSGERGADMGCEHEWGLEGIHANGDSTETLTYRCRSCGIGWASTYDPWAGGRFPKPPTAGKPWGLEAKLESEPLVTARECPKCGCQETCYGAFELDDRPLWRVVCPECGFSMDKYARTKALAAAAWNALPREGSQQDPLEELLRGMLDDFTAGKYGSREDCSGDYAAKVRAALGCPWS